MLLATRVVPWDWQVTGKWALFGGGPVDGRVDPVEPETLELTVVMSDGQRHRYVRSDDVVEIDSGRRCAVFRYAGRVYGPS